MRRIFARLGCAHEHLWKQGGFYRIALLLGPAPLAGLALGAALWSGYHALTRTEEPVVPWAAAPPPIEPEQGPVALSPWRPLPALDADGVPADYTRGWLVTAHAVTISSVMNVEISRQVLGPLALNSSVADMGGILAERPQSDLFVAVANGALVVHEPGSYRLTARLERPAGRPTQCDVRLVLGAKRVIWSLNIGSDRASRHMFDPMTFDLKPGLYRIGYSFGCWDAGAMVNVGRLSIVMQRPGETEFSPIRAEEVVR
ncbi:MAG TPA: hypothetical protein VHB27_04140 [Rhodopila sp.]|uniref:hypothetical protein n=1 Tax=Rhodopila sp. TaxID=2480087 RepID=UPI002C186282|nr:hypothetical protein [Rhodopila sp.]HVY14393.1 hypothetical protein [Rhodopila sp.]